MDHADGRRRLALLVLVPYLLALAYVALWPRYGVSGAIQANWVPGESILELFARPAPARLVVRNLLGNFLLLTPLAVLLVAGLGRTRGCALSTCAATSLAIEVLQASGMLDGRGLNVDDVLLNVVGAAAAAGGAPPSQPRR